MKIKTLLFFLLLLACSKNLFAQYQFTGKVTEIIDGRTVVITTDENKQVTFELLYIEVPEPKQPLSETVFNHLKRMVSGKTVTLIVKGKYSKGLTGRMFLDGIDVARRMLRDGAAWYNLPEQPYADVRRDYQQDESLAKAEKRGIWGIEGMKTAWEFRAEQFAKKVEAEKAKLKPAKEVLMWADIPNAPTNSSYKTDYDKFNNITSISTSPMDVNITNRKLSDFKLRLIVTHSFFGEDSKKSSEDQFVFRFIAKSIFSHFSFSTKLNLLTANDRFFLEAKENIRDIDFNEKDSVFGEFYKHSLVRFQMNKKDFQTFIEADQSEFRLDQFEGIISSGQMAVLKNLP